jgi:RNA polymerase sigma-70 factor (ECF subfamily)
LDIESIWFKYHQKLLNFIKKRVAVADAEDVLHEVFLKIQTRIGSLKEDTKLESWIFQITRNTVIDYYRSKRPTEPLPDWLEQEKEAELEGVKQELCSCFTPMIGHLPEHYRQAIKLSKLEGKTQKEVAELESITLSGAKSRVQRGRAMLRSMLLDCCDVELSKDNSLLSCDPKKEGDCKNC